MILQLKFAFISLPFYVVIYVFTFPYDFLFYLSIHQKFIYLVIHSFMLLFMHSFAKHQRTGTQK